MPGRFALTYAKWEIEQYLDINIPFDLRSRYNISPTQQCLVLCTEDKIPQFMHWGFSPFWNTHHQFKELINARSESAQEKPMFRKAFKEHRCVVIASGYYEWKETSGEKGSHKTPFYISFKDDSPLLFGAIWDKCEADDGIIHTGFACLTTEPNAMIKKIHERMPVIIDKQKVDIWLKGDTPSAHLVKLCKPFPAKHFKMREVSSLVNNAKNDKPDCVKGID